VTAEMPRRRFSRVLPMRALIPNAITLAALCFGLTGVRFAIAGDFERAILAVVIAGVLDGIDGRVARLLKGQSRFGAELDSLSDLTAHGVAPALIIYLWSLQNLSIPGITGGWLKIGNIGWIVALAHAACCALRLARFNANLDVDDQPHKRAGFLTGVPAPVGAGLTLSPIFLDLWLETAFFRQPPVTALIVGTTALLLVSSLPTYSWKRVRVRREWRLFLLLFVALFAGALLSAPWMTLSLTALAYAASIPFSVRAYAAVRRRALVQDATGETRAGPLPGEPPAA
jgi:CDP-diacylglycerol--serine O-phosphatidyltransferase